jgi:hypothetical protein
VKRWCFFPFFFFFLLFCSGLSGAIRSVPASTFLNAHVVENRLVISYYPMIVAKGIRRRCVLEIGMTSADHAASWCLSVRSVLFGDDVGAVPRRHILVLVNPFGEIVGWLVFLCC